jgi:hypothetical protein
MTITDEALMLAVRDGDVDSAAVLFDRYHRALFAYIYRMLGDRVTADDLVQQVFAQCCSAVLAGNDSGGTTSFPPGLLILRRELLAGLDPEGRIGWQDAIGIHVLVHEVVGIFDDDVAGELEGCGVQREALDDVQLAAVRK